MSFNLPTTNPSGRNRDEAGIGFTPAYQTAGIPYATASITIPANTAGAAHIVDLPYISSWIALKNEGAETIRLGFSLNGVKGTENNNYVTIKENESFSAFIKCAKVFLLSNSALEAVGTFFAGLTGIRTNQLVNNWSGSAGIG